ncbi:MAG: glycosyltransferase family 2 protein [Acidimicrobiales bacterium]
MSRRLLDVEVTEPFDGLAAGVDDGFAVRVRCGGRIVGYVLQRVGPGRAVDAAELDAIMAREAGADVARAVIEDELRSRMDLIALAEPTITVAVCSRNRSARLARCLASILQAVSGEPRIEVLVVDNAPDDDSTMRLVDGLDGVRYVREPLPGLDFARNRALAESKSDVLAYVDDDVVVDPRWIRGLRLAFNDHPDAGCVTGLVLPLELRTEAQVRFEQRGGFRRGFTRLRFEGPVDATDRLFPFGAGRFGAGCNMAFRRSVLEALDGFDDALDTGPPLPGGGDLDIFFRVLRAGYPLIYEPTAIVCHEHRDQHRDLRRQYWSWGTGMSAFLGKCWRRPEDRATIAALARWWLAYEARLLAKGVLGRGGMTVDLAAAELVGGVVGAAGGYARSERRIEALRAGHR